MTPRDQFLHTSSYKRQKQKKKEKKRRNKPKKTLNIYSSAGRQMMRHRLRIGFLGEYHDSLLLKASQLQFIIHDVSKNKRKQKKQKTKDTHQKKEEKTFTWYVCKLQGQIRIEVMLFSLLAKSNKKSFFSRKVAK